METFIASSIVFFLSIFILSIGTLFFGRRASTTSCSSNPMKTPSPEGSRCATGDAGLCPFDDNIGALKMQAKTKLNR
jgi:hypothetical protein